MDAPPRPVPANAARWMDATRAVLAGVVAFSHAWGLIVADHRPGDALAGYPFFFLAGFAHPAVILFFVLSGFWIAKSVEALDLRGWAWRRFLIDRWSRLAIVVLPALVLGGSLDAIGTWWLETPTHLGLTDVWFIESDLTKTLSINVLIGNLFFLEHIIVTPLGSNEPLWSVAFEFWFYLWFAALWVTVRHRRLEPMLLTLALAFFSANLAYGFLAWLAGAAAYHLRGRFSRRLMMPVGAILSAALVWARLGDWFAEDLVVALAAAAFVLALVARDPAFPGPLTPLARFGAVGSFSLYAIHFPIMMMAAGLIVGAARLTPGAGPAIIVALVLASTIGIAMCFARLTEARTGRLRDWLNRRIAG